MFLLGYIIGVFSVVVPSGISGELASESLNTISLDCILFFILDLSNLL